MGSKTKNRLVDALYLALAIVPFLLAMTLKVLTAPATEGVSITGAMIFFTVDMPIQAWPVTEAQVNSLAVMLSMLGLCLYLTHGLQVVPGSKRQLIAEWIVEKVTNLVQNSMGERFMGFVPFIAAILGLSALSSLSSLLGLFPPTSDLNIVAGWAILVFILITYYKLQGGLWPYVKGFFTPVPLFAPMNVLGEVATPVSMSFRHYGNVLSGVIISALVGTALKGLSNMLLGWLKNLEAPPRQVFVNHGNDTVCDSFAAAVTETLGIPAAAPYPGSVYDLSTGAEIVQGNRQTLTARRATPGRTAAAGVFQRLQAAGRRLLGIIEKNRDDANKDLARFADQITALCDKWDR